MYIDPTLPHDGIDWHFGDPSRRIRAMLYQHDDLRAGLAAVAIYGLEAIADEHNVLDLNHVDSQMLNHAWQTADAAIQNYASGERIVIDSEGFKVVLTDRIEGNTLDVFDHKYNEELQARASGPALGITAAMGIIEDVENWTRDFSPMAEHYSSSQAPADRPDEVVAELAEIEARSKIETDLELIDALKERIEKVRLKVKAKTWYE